MAIISGMKPVTIDDVKPFELPVSEMSAALNATQQRADEVKNTIALGDSALAIETRPLQEDMDMAAQVQNEYKTEVENLLNSVGGDWSKVDNSQIQSLATKYASDDRVRYLTSAKKNYDAYNELQKKIQSERGQALSFGPIDPLTMSLKDEYGNWRNFSDWDLEQQLDHIGSAQKLFKNLGTELRTATGFRCSKSESEYPSQCQDEFTIWWDTYTKTSESNMRPIQHIIDNGIALFSDTVEGIQYRRLKEQQYKKQGYSENEIKDLVNNDVKTLIFAIGKSQQVAKEIESAKREITIIPENKRKSGSGGEKPTDVAEIIINPHTDNQTYRAPDVKISLVDEVYNIEKESFHIANIEDALANPTSVNNIAAFKFLLGGVTDSRSMLEQGQTQGDKKFFNGLLANLDAQAINEDFEYNGKNNRAVLAVARTIKGQTAEEKLKYLQKEGNEHLLFDDDDYVTAYKEVYGSTLSDDKIKNKLYGSSKGIDGVASSIDIIEDKDANTLLFDKSKLLLKIRDNLVGKEDEYSKYKLEKVENKLKQIDEFLSNEDNKETMLKYKRHYSNLRNKVEAYRTWDKLLLTKHGLDPKELHDLELVMGGKSATEEGGKKAGENLFMKAEEEAMSMFLKENDKSGNFITEDGIEVSRVDPRNISRLLKYFGKKNEASSINFVDNFDNILNSIIKQEFSASEFRRVLGDEEYEKQLKFINSKWGENDYRRSQRMLSVYFEKLLTTDDYKLDLEDVKNGTLRKKDLLNHAIGLKSFFNIDKNGDIVFDQDRTGSHAYEQIHNNKKTYFENSLKNKGSRHTKALFDYFNEMDGLRKDYTAKNTIWLQSGESDKSGWGDISFRTIEQVAASVNSESIKLYNMTFNRQEGQEEEFNVKLLHDAFNLWNRTAAGDQKGSPDFKKFLGEIFEGIVYDYDNPNRPFSAVLAVPIYDNNGNRKSIKRVETEISPDPEDLYRFGIDLLDLRYFNEIRTQMQQNNKTFVELTLGNTKQKYYNAPADINSEIKRGMFFTLDGNGRPIPIGTNGTAQDVVDHFSGKVFSGVNKTMLDEINKDIEILRKNPTNKYILDKYGSKDGNQLMRLLTESSNNLLNKKSATDGIDENTGSNFNPTSSELQTMINNSRAEEVTEDLVKDNILRKNPKDLTNEEALAIYKKFQPDAFKNNNFEIINGEIYTIPKNGLVKGGLDNKKGIKPTGPNLQVGQEINNFATLLDKMLSFDKTTLNELGITEEDVKIYFDVNNPITIGSTRRSLKDNIAAYGTRLDELTDSKHSSGEAMDIWTRIAPRPSKESKDLFYKVMRGEIQESSLTADQRKKIANVEKALEVDKDGDGYYDADLPALKFEAFLQTEAGKKLLKKAGLTVYIHSRPGTPGGGRHLHIDNLNRWNYNPNGVVYEHMFTPYQLKKN